MPNLSQTLASYVPPGIVRRILQEAEPRPPTGPRAERLQAAVLFADLSGFSPLTAALARQGPAGAEEMTALLNRCFERIIAPIEAQGGEVVEFGGDALIVLFSAAEESLGRAVRRAEQAAQAVQAAMAGLGLLQSSVGPISLALKVSIGAGPLLAMEVGGVRGRWDYVLAGDPLRQVSEADKRAGRGQVLLSPEAAAVVVAGPLPPRPLSQPDWSAVDTPAVQAALRHYVPGPVQAWLEQGLHGWLAALRQMSVLFVGLEGLSDAREDVIGSLHCLVRAAQRVIYRYEGTLSRVAVDDKGPLLMVLFGAPPLAHEDDARRAVRCALELAEVVSAEEGLHLSIGVTTGRLFAGPVGSAERREYTVIGDAVNLAARLMGAASRRRPSGASNILCDFESYRQSRERVAFAELAPIRVKGQPDLVRVYRPEGAVDQRSAPVEQRPLVGRRAELARLEVALDALQGGGGRLLLISGEAGIGKSRLVQELSRRAQERGLVWLAGAGYSIEQQTPYRPWRDVLLAYFALEGRAASEWPEQVRDLVRGVAPEQMPRLPLLNDVLDLDLPDSDLTADLDPAQRQQNLSLLLLALLRAWTREKPLLLVLEDAHWMDSLSWDLAAYAARALVPAQPLLLVLVARPLGPTSLGGRHLAALRGLEQVETLALETMAPDETVALAAARLGLPEDGLPAPLADLVRRRAGGNPFFAEELVLALRDQGLLHLEGDPGQLRCTLPAGAGPAERALPDTVQGLVLARVDRLPPQRQLTLKVGAVIGRVFGYRPLRYTMQRHTSIGDQGLKEHLQALASLDLTPVETPDPDLAYRFRHVITQQVAYGTLLYAQRRELHGTVAAWYERDPQADENLALLVHHCHHAGQADEERRYARRAGERAAARFANAEAVRYLGRALELSADPLERYELLLLREEVYELLGRREAQLADLEALEELAAGLGSAQQARVLLRRAGYAQITGDYAGAVQSARRAAGQSTDPVLRSRARRAWAEALLRCGDLAGAREQLETALSLARAAGSVRSEADCLYSMANVTAMQGDFDGAVGHHERAEALYRKAGDRRGAGQVHLALGKALLLRGDHAGAAVRYERAVQTCRELGDRRGESMALGALAGVASARDRFPQAEDYYRQALLIAREIGDTYGEGTWQQALGLVSLGRGRYGAAIAAYERALAIFERVGGEVRAAASYGQLGLVYLALGRAGRAGELFERGCQSARQVQMPIIEGQTQSYLGLLYLQQGEHEQARQYAQQALETAQACRDLLGQANAWLVLGHARSGAGQWAEAAEAYEQSLAVWRVLGWLNPPVEARAGLAGVALERGDLERALAQVEAILAHLYEHSLDGALEPFRVYLSCCRVLEARGDPRAREVQVAAQRLLQERAGRIEPEELRRSFLQDVPVHRRILEAG